MNGTPIRKKTETHIAGYKLSEDRLYNVWNTMLARCYNPKNPSYHNYGGRGISVCEAWRNSFFEFKGWAISAGYDYSKERKEQAIDRVDNDADYCPENCKWVSMRENNSHRRYLGRKPYKHHKKHKVHDNIGVVWEINGIKKAMSDWCAEYGVSYQLAQYRVKKAGMTPLEALTAPKAHTNGRPKKRAATLTADKTNSVTTRPPETEATETEIIIASCGETVNTVT